MHSVVLHEMVRVTVWAQLLQDKLTQQKAPVLLTSLLHFALVVHQLCFLLTSPRAHGESCLQGEMRHEEMRHEAFFAERQRVQAESNDQLRETLC